MRNHLFAGLSGLAIVMASGVLAQDVAITANKPQSTFSLNGQTFTIMREQDQDHTLAGDYAKTSRACPPFCITPITAARNVPTVGELETIAFLEAEVAAGDGLLIDARVPQWFAQGTIPGAVNVPFSTLAEDNPYRVDILRALGAEQVGNTLDFSNARQLTVFCSGPWSDQSVRAIRNLLASGYPAERIRYYRGGMQAWQSLGLTVLNPQNAG